MLIGQWPGGSHAPATAKTLVGVHDTLLGTHKLRTPTGRTPCLGSAGLWVSHGRRSIALCQRRMWLPRPARVVKATS